MTEMNRSLSLANLSERPSKAINVKTLARRKNHRERLLNGVQNVLTQDTLQDALMYKLQQKIVAEKLPVLSNVAQGPRMRRQYRLHARRILHDKDREAVKAVKKQLKEATLPFSHSCVRSRAGPTKLLKIQAPLLQHSVHHLKAKLLLRSPSTSSLNILQLDQTDFNSPSSRSLSSESSSSSTHTSNTVDKLQQPKLQNRSSSVASLRRSSTGEQRNSLARSRSTAILHRTKKRVSGTNLHRHMLLRFLFRNQISIDLPALEIDLRDRINREFGEFNDDMIAWSLFDKEGSGEITFEQFVAATNDLGMQLEEQASKMLFFRFDGFGTGKISFHDFMTRLLNRDTVPGRVRMAA